MTRNLQKRQDEIRGRRERRKLARLARTRRQVTRYILLALMIGVGATGFTAMPWAISDPMRDIEVHGNHVVTDDQIRVALKDVLNCPLYRVNPLTLEQRVCSLPAVKYAFVRRYVLPHPRLKVEVMEEFPWATCCSTPEGPAEAVLSQDGRVIPIAQFPSVVQPPLRICAPPNLKLSPTGIAQWDSWVRLISEQTGQPVEMIDMRQPTAIEAKSGELDLHLGAADSTLTRRLSRLSSVLPVVANLKDKLRYIDLSLDSNVPLKINKNGAATQINTATLPTRGAL